MPEQPLVSTGSSGIQFFDSLLPLTQSARPPLIPYHCALLVLITGGHVVPLVTSIGHQVLPVQPLPRE